MGRESEWRSRLPQTCTVFIPSCPRCSQHSAEVGSETVFTSSNSFYLTTSWQHVLYSALHQSPVVELDAYMATSPSSSKSTKVDIVCQGGKRWIRVLTIKPMSLLSEFRSAESYVVDDDDDDDDSSLSDGEGGKDHLSLDIINHQLARGEVDGIASQCSIMKVARELQMAADLAEKRNSWGRPMVEVALTRLSMDERGSSLQGKFYDDEEERRFEARIRAIDVEMQKMQLLVVSKTGRRLFREGEQDGFLPSSIASGEASLDERMCLLPRLAPPRKVKTPSPTATLNLDLSALVAFVSQISHIPLPHLSDADEVDKCFRKDHWKAEPQPEARTLDEEKTTADVEEEKGNDTQHARALRDQLRREMTTDTFFDAVLGHLEGEERLTLVCTKHVEEKFHEILSLVGGPTEQKRARSLFDEQGQDDFWKGSRWEGNSDVRSRIVLPVRSVAFSASDVSLPSSKNDSFECLARHSVQEGLKDLLDPASSSHGNVGTGVQRQTPHTLTSILYGLVHNCSTLTTNIASIKWLARDIQRHELAEACAKGHVENSYRASFASAVLFYPRSLAEKMMTSTYLPSAPDHNINITSFEWTGSTSRDDDRLVPRTPSDSYKETTAVRSSPTESVLEKAAISDSEGPHEALSQFERPVREKRLGGGYRATKRWLQGPRPRSALLIRHYRWWPLQPLEETWLRWTAPLAWKDPNQLVTRSAMQDVEEQHPDLPLRDEVACKKKDAWISGVARDWRRNRLHWIALALTFIGWAFGFTFLVKDLWYDASVVSDDGSAVSPSFFGCTTTFWTANSGCGLDGSLCAPFSSPTSVPFRCPASCETTTLGGARAVGDQLPSYVTLVVGGGHQGNSTSLDPVEATGPFIYRGDSFVCSAAIHAGVFSSDKGGCSSIWLNGAYSGYQGIERHGIQSTPFNSSFPLSYYFDENVVGQKCTDRSSRGYILDIILLAWTGFVLQPKRIVYFFTLVVVGFWHINFISEPREYPMSVGDPMGDFLPTLFIAYALWRLTFRFVWPAFERFPLERNVWIQGFYWMGVLLNVVFANVPLGRLVASQIASEPGAVSKSDAVQQSYATLSLTSCHSHPLSAHLAHYNHRCRGGDCVEPDPRHSKGRQATQVLGVERSRWDHRWSSGGHSDDGPSTTSLYHCHGTSPLHCFSNSPVPHLLCLSPRHVSQRRRPMGLRRPHPRRGHDSWIRHHWHWLAFLFRRYKLDWRDWVWRSRRQQWSGVLAGHSCESVGPVGLVSTSRR